MSDLKLNCPIPLQYEHITMAHGGGGRMMQKLIDDVIQPIFNNPILNQKHDSAILSMPSGKLAFTTDSYVVNPLFFAGGDIGKMAVCGTLNDLAMSGAKPLYLTCALIIEEGFSIKDLQTILASMQATAEQAGVSIVTGDTKVVEKGKGDGLYINTAGVGCIAENIQVHAQNIEIGDQIIINSDLGRHGMSIMLEREGIDFKNQLQSDCADVSGLVQQLLDKNLPIHCMRDLTRGGLASGLIELATNSKHKYTLQEQTLPVHETVKTACEILGFDALYSANEGCFALFIPKSASAEAISCLQQHPLGQQACIIGEVTETHDKGLVTVETPLGIQRSLELFSGEQLPRIC